jgi:preprotein translocase subunit SecG
MQTLLLVAELVIAVVLVVFVLLQRSEGGALGMGGGGGGGMGGLFSPRGAADTLTRTTAILAVLFFLTCIGLDLLAQRPVTTGAESLLRQPSTVPVRAPTPAPLPTGPQVPKPQ